MTATVGAGRANLPGLREYTWIRSGGDTRAAGELGSDSGGDKISGDIFGEKFWYGIDLGEEETDLTDEEGEEGEIRGDLPGET